MHFCASLTAMSYMLYGNDNVSLLIIQVILVDNANVMFITNGTVGLKSWRQTRRISLSYCLT